MIADGDLQTYRIAAQLTIILLLGGLGGNPLQIKKCIITCRIGFCLQTAQSVCVNRSGKNMVASSSGRALLLVAR